MTNQHCVFKTEAPSQVNNQDRLCFQRNKHNWWMCEETVFIVLGTTPRGNSFLQDDKPHGCIIVLTLVLHAKEHLEFTKDGFV